MKAAEAMAQVASEHRDHPLVQELLCSIRASQTGRQGRAAEPAREGKQGGI